MKCKLKNLGIPLVGLSSAPEAAEILTAHPEKFKLYLAEAMHLLLQDSLLAQVL